MIYLIGLFSFIMVEMILMCIIPMLAGGVADIIGGVRIYILVLIVISSLLAIVLYLYRRNKINASQDFPKRNISKILICFIMGIAIYNVFLLLLFLDRGTSTYGIVLLYIPMYFGLSTALPFVVWVFYISAKYAYQHLKTFRIR